VNIFAKLIMKSALLGIVISFSVNVQNIPYEKYMAPGMEFETKCARQWLIRLTVADHHV